MTAKEGNRKLASLEWEKWHDTNVIYSSHFKPNRKSAFFLMNTKKMPFYKEQTVEFYLSMYLPAAQH